MRNPKCPKIREGNQWISTDNNGKVFLVYIERHDLWKWS